MTIEITNKMIVMVCQPECPRDILLDMVAQCEHINRLSPSKDMANLIAYLDNRLEKDNPNYIKQPVDYDQLAIYICKLQDVVRYYGKTLTPEKIIFGVDGF